ncbi:MAG TPA: TrkA C-terminal domain-containing protein [Acidimicrobiales bacterium]|nr:TrkA C-terminal domain-containing protein [Acidimicrobiales bacterium]
MVAIASLLLVIALSLLITRIATVILSATGMSRSAARFQARSAFSGTGFTTSEAEQVVDHPLRRKVIGTLMLLGNAGIVAAASSTILGFRGGGVGQAWWRILELVAGLFALVMISKSSWVDQRLTATIGSLLHRFTDLPTRDLASLIDLGGSYAINELAVDGGDWVADRALGDLALRDEGVVVLGLNRRGAGYLGAPTARTVVRAGDVLIVYGRQELLNELDDRPAGAEGDLAHRAAVALQHRTESDQQVAEVTST